MMLLSMPIVCVVWRAASATNPCSVPRSASKLHNDPEKTGGANPSRSGSHADTCRKGVMNTPAQIPRSPSRPKSGSRK